MKTKQIEHEETEETEEGIIKFMARFNSNTHHKLKSFAGAVCRPMYEVIDAAVDAYIDAALSAED